MIKNERQYRITKAQAERFERDLGHLSVGQPKDSEVHPRIRQAQRDAVASQLADLRAEVEEYETLQRIGHRVLSVKSFEEFPQSLIRARIAAGISQKDLAERLGLKEQQIQRYEATDYASASLERMKEVVRALGLKVTQEIFLPELDPSPDVFFRRLKDLGFERAWVEKRLLPPGLAERLRNTKTRSEETGQLALRAAEVVGRVLSVPPASLFGREPLQLGHTASGSARFKVRVGASEQLTSAYTVYAHHLALLLLQATSELSAQPIPTEAGEVREAVLHKFGTLTFANALRYVWGLGVPVLPLRDGGAFHGACWRVGGRNVIVLKQNTASLWRWLFDLLHELRHAGDELGQSELSVVEGAETSPERRESEGEIEASRFAGDAALDERAEELAQKCVSAAGGRVERLKVTLPRVAAHEGVPVDALANYMAFRLSLQGINWWGAANNLQSRGDDPWRVARDVLLEHIRFEALNPADRALLQQALTEE